MSLDNLPPRADRAGIHLFLLFGLALLIGCYALLRYGGWWGETDTASMTRVIAATLESGTLAPAGRSYENGYAYQALVAWLVAITGMPLAALQLFGGAAAPGLGGAARLAGLSPIHPLRAGCHPWRS